MISRAAQGAATSAVTRAGTPAAITPGETPAERILIVDDEPKIRSFIGRALTGAGYATDFAVSGDEAIARVATSHYDLVILDLVMEGMDGREALGLVLKARPRQAVLVLSCVADVATKVECLERGALDYLTKPFSLAELLARVRLRLRHVQPASLAANGGGRLTLDTIHLVADAGNGPVHLTRLEFMLLRELAEHAGHAVAKGQLLSTVWGYDFDPGSNVVDVCVRRLRAKLGFDLIKTVRGEGYQLADR